LTGRRSNRDALGAEVKLTTTHGSQFVTVTTSGGYRPRTTTGALRPGLRYCRSSEHVRPSEKEPLSSKIASIVRSSTLANARRKLAMLYGFQFVDVLHGRRYPALRSNMFSPRRRRPLSAIHPSIMSLRLGMTLLVCCWPMVARSQEPCRLSHDTDATAHQTQEEAADAQGVLFLRNKNTHCDSNQP
jgi:hypothetical protein